MLEAVHEGFRLVLEVDETKGTSLSEVHFGARQMALFRIDDYNDSKSWKTCFCTGSQACITFSQNSIAELVFGFKNAELGITERPGTNDYPLPVALVSGITEFSLTYRFTVGANTTAQMGSGMSVFILRRKMLIVTTLFNVSFLEWIGSMCFEKLHFSKL